MLWLYMNLDLFGGDDTYGEGEHFFLEGVPRLVKIAGESDMVVRMRVEMILHLLCSTRRALVVRLTK